MGVGQFFIEMIIGAAALGAIITFSKVHNFIWIPVVGFLAGYVISQDTPYSFSNVFGGLTFSLLCSFIAGVWIQQQKKKEKYTENQESIKKSIDRSGDVHPLRKILDEPESIGSKNNSTKESNYELFHGGDGLSKNSPVSINCASMELAKSYIDIFIKDNCGDDCKRTDLEYTISNPNDSKKFIKVISVKKPDETKMEFFFDLSRQVNNFTNMVNIFSDRDIDTLEQTNLKERKLAVTKKSCRQMLQDKGYILHCPMFEGFWVGVKSDEKKDVFTNVYDTRSVTDLYNWAINAKDLS